MRKIKQKKKYYNYRTNIGVSIMKQDLDLFKEKCKALNYSQSEIFRKLIKDFNETTIVLVKE